MAFSPYNWITRQDHEPRDENLHCTGAQILVCEKTVCFLVEEKKKKRFLDKVSNFK